MGRRSVEPGLRQKLVDRMRAGEKASTLAAETGLNPSTVQKWFAADSAEPRGVPPPAPAEKKGGGAYKNSGGRRPITEQTAGMLCAGLFTIAAIFDGETWLLTTVERDALAGPFADSMRALPSPVAGAINTYSAPATFVCVFTAIVNHKVRVRREARKPKATPPPIARPNTNGATHAAPTAPGAQPSGVVPPAPFASAPPANGAVRIDPLLAEALAAARGGLRDLDPQEETEATFA